MIRLLWPLIGTAPAVSLSLCLPFSLSFLGMDHGKEKLSLSHRLPFAFLAASNLILEIEFTEGN